MMRVQKKGKDGMCEENKEKSGRFAERKGRIEKKINKKNYE